MKKNKNIYYEKIGEQSGLVYEDGPEGGIESDFEREDAKVFDWSNISILKAFASMNSYSNNTIRNRYETALS